MQKKKVAVRKLLRKIWTYSILSLGAIIFLIPFFWLVTTSMKSNEEYKAQPPRWLPPLPYPVNCSPYVATNEFTDFPQPAGINDQQWQQIKPRLIDSTWHQINRLQNPTFIKIINDREKYQRLGSDLKQTLINGILFRIIQELRERIYEKGAFEIINDLIQKNPLTAEKIFSACQNLLGSSEDSIQIYHRLPVDTLELFQPAPRDEEIYLAAWNVAIEQLGDYQLEEKLKEQVTQINPELWNPFIRFCGKKIWENAISRHQTYTRQRTEIEMIQKIIQGLHADRLDKNLVRLYRNVVLGKMTIQSRDNVDYNFIDSLRNSGLSWYDLQGNRLEEFNIDAKVCVEVPYDFSKTDCVQVQFRGNLPIPFEQVDRLILPIRGDLSFHEIWLSIETSGKCYQAREAFRLNDHIWIGAIWQRTSDAEIKKSGLTLRGQQIIEFYADSTSASSVTAADQAVLTLTVKRIPFLIAAWRKFSQNYFDTFRFVSFLRFFLNSTILTILNIGAQLLICPLIAYGFSRIKWPGRDIVFGLVLATMMLPHQVTMIPQFLIFRHLGMYDTLFPLWLPSLFGTGFYIFLLRQFFLTIPYDYEEAAKLDGCGFIRRYFYISLPLIQPALAAVVIFQFMATWNDFLRPLIFLNSEEKIPLPLGLFMFKTGWWNQEFGLLMAAAVIMLLPVVIVFFLAQRHFIESISLTGAKG